MFLECEWFVFTAMSVMMLSAFVGGDPVETFVADHPFVAAIFVEGAPFFLATHRGE